MGSRSYRMTADNGNAPCAFNTLRQIVKFKDNNLNQYKFELLTLSTCGSKFRHLMSLGEWVFGIAGNRFGHLVNNLLWVGQVDEITSKGEYFLRLNTNKKYDTNSRPDNYYGYMENICSSQKILEYGDGFDNTGLRKYVMFDNPYHQLCDIKRDLYRTVHKNTPLAITLWFKEWWYFGKNAIEIDSDLIAKGIEARELDEKVVRKFLRRIKKEYPEGGIFGSPASLDMEIGFDIGSEKHDACCSCKPPEIAKKFKSSTWKEYLRWWCNNKNND